MTRVNYCRGPRLTIRFTLPPFRRRFRGAGRCAITRPRLTVEEEASRTLPSLQWARTIAFFAALSVFRFTFGTRHGAGGAFTLVVALSELFVVSGSGVADETVAVFEIFPIAFARATIVTVALAPLASGPRSQRTGALLVQPPWLGLAETSAKPGGSGSLTVTAPADRGP